MVKLFLEVGVIVLTPFNFSIGRGALRVRETIGPKDITEIYCDGPLEIYEKRDMKDLYQKARAG